MFEPHATIPTCSISATRKPLATGRSYRWGSCCNIPCLVDAAALCAVVPDALLVITTRRVRSVSRRVPQALSIPRHHWRRY
jgi:hypothetical protein